jgi:hypothetical protein
LKVEEAYRRFLNKVNKNDSNADLNIDLARFVISYNEEQDRWQAQSLSAKGDSSLLDDLSFLLTSNERHNPIRANIHKDRVVFPLPKDLFRYEWSRTWASTDKCSRFLDNQRAAPRNLPLLLRDAFNDPSFETEETVVNFTSGGMEVSKKDFEIDYVEITYYRKLKRIDIVGYIHTDGTPSTSIDPELDDRFVDQIVNRMADEFNRKVDNREGLPMSRDRVRTEEKL